MAFVTQGIVARDKNNNIPFWETYVFFRYTTHNDSELGALFLCDNVYACMHMFMGLLESRVEQSGSKNEE